MLTSPFSLFFLFFFFNDTATTEIYTLSLHDALPICCNLTEGVSTHRAFRLAASLTGPGRAGQPHPQSDRKSTRLNSSHSQISYAVFCLKKKKHKTTQPTTDRKHKDSHQQDSLEIRAH